VSREDNVAIIRRIWADPLGQIPHLVAEDLDYRAMEGAPDDVGVMHGRDAYTRYLTDWYETFEGFHTELVEAEAIDDDRVLVVGRISGKARASGIDTDLTFAAVYTLRDGLIVRGREYESKEAALAAVSP
jgi:ketosteroid isomerase-like protein